MKKRIMLVGPAQAGKSTLANLLNGTSRPLKKTQDVIYGPQTIDTPSSYLENPSMYKYLIATAQSASHLLLLLDSSRIASIYPPGFGKTFTCPVSGVITKIDLGLENVQLCREMLERSGVCEGFFPVSLQEGSGVEALKAFLFK
ncbi:EutP/PduV family microcompartment system protein [Desulfosporosinus sp. PR]|uniref:EutP/PduV family microcompartment system protein n=1 Tax=Candidatus Desulfosporosinus nitrosoreducens TaxID=3401928 RepID=UPI0027F3386C|nr:EutP/PduV family microcompartment system protein [Desulfosporosinus sp. PR]MDQ7095097.1 EutP/PduV family microcompartment system protein [Desulfosporosinus sp. PR]